MRNIDLSFSQVQTMGYVSDGKLICSAHGKHGKGITLRSDEPAVKGDDGIVFRPKVRFLEIPDATFTLVEKNGYVAVIHESLPIDTFIDEPGFMLATFSLRNNRFRSIKGKPKLSWLETPRTAGTASFIDGAYLVTLLESRRYPTVVAVAEPHEYLDRRTRELASGLVPFGLLSGFVLSAGVALIARRKMSMSAYLEKALNRDAFFLMYQPIVDLQSHLVVGAEALARWRLMDGTVVCPDVFIPLAEEKDLIQKLTRRVVELIERDAQDLFKEFPDFYISINLSQADLQSEKTVDLLQGLVNKKHIAPGNIVAETTERGLVDMDLAGKVVNGIRALGIGIAIDDFGTGYSSLVRLCAFAPDYLKIDRFFVRTIGSDVVTDQLALHIIEIAKSLKLRAVAEGVETEIQAEFLRSKGVQFAQGNLFCKPEQISELIRMLAEQRRPPEASH